MDAAAEGGRQVNRSCRPAAGLSTGTIDDVEIGFAFLPTYWGRGLATESAKFCLDLARTDLGLQTLIGITEPKNLASQHVLSKLGLSYECDTIVESTQCFLSREI